MRRLAAGVIALIGLWVILDAIIAVISLMNFAAFSSEDDETFRALLLAGVLTCVFAALVGTLIIAWRSRLAGRWFAVDPLPGSIGAPTLLRIGLILVGIMFMVWGAVGFVRHLGVALAIDSQNHAAAFTPLFSPFRDAMPDLVSNLVELVLGLGVVMASNRLAHRLLGEPILEDTPPDSGPTRLAQCPECGASFDPADYRGGLFAAVCDGCGAPLDIEGAEQAVAADALPSE